MPQILRRLFGDPSKRTIQRLMPLVAQINALEAETHAMGDEALREQTEAFRARITAATRQTAEQLLELEADLAREPDEDERRRLRYEIDEARKRLDAEERDVLDEILPRAFAAVREASIRANGQRHFDEQILGGIVLHRNMIAEMKTGEGKTLVATLPLYLNSLTGRGVHLVTPNDYLSKLGVQWMGPIYHLLGVTVGVIQSMGQDPKMSSFLYDPDYISADDRYQHLCPCSRAEAYHADITYGTNNEFGFDYLRDNMVSDNSQRVMRELYCAIVDEVDNILIDEARTPLIISGEAEESAASYRRFAQIVSRLSEGSDYTVDEKRTVVTITEHGLDKVEAALGIDNLYSPEHVELTPYLENALKAKALFQRDRNYVVSDGQVLIVDEFTGRLMYGRRYSEGLHQAIEAKENVPIQRESLTLATITFQNYFRMYRRLAGMTGTAETEAEEFAQIYNLEVVVIPTHEPLIRVDYPDVVYKTAEAKYRAVLKEIEDCHRRMQPVLVGTLAIETSEMLSERLKRMRIPHEVLNAKYHEKEAQIIAQAGRPAAVTIATNMAGRGVDILLGGNPEGLAREALRREGVDLATLPAERWAEALAAARRQCEADRKVVVQAGGLHVLGTERYEARRIDNQLRGRSGRQGDPGSSRFYVSLEDDLMRRFGGESVARMMDRLGVEEDVPIEHSMVTKAISSAQVRVEGHNFDLRKHLLEYDDVVNQQRRVIYDQRATVLSEADLRPIVLDIITQQLDRLVELHTASDDEAWDLVTLHQAAGRLIHLPAGHRPSDWEGMSVAQIKRHLREAAAECYQARESALGADTMRQIERIVMLRAIDRHWVRHLTALDELREGIGLRAVGQRDPLVEYKREAFDAFDQLLQAIQEEIAAMILNVQLLRQPAAPPPAQRAPIHGPGAGGGPPRKVAHLGRNALCPCGSGKKYKACCLRKGLSPEEAAAQGAAAGRKEAASRSRGQEATPAGALAPRPRSRERVR